MWYIYLKLYVYVLIDVNFLGILNIFYLVGRNSLMNLFLYKSKELIFDVYILYSMLEWYI